MGEEIKVEVETEVIEATEAIEEIEGIDPTVAKVAQAVHPATRTVQAAKVPQAAHLANQFRVAK